MEKWRKPTEEEAKRSGGLMVPNEEHPEWKAVVKAMAEDICKKIDEDLIKLFNSK